ncbi:CapA family protein [Demequina zhanjiangensis]|uniref:CapA family protein n=1 Tax=Demequina zhanjiangensis TaxID=3051659 RepID=A0ABT8G3C0_9MICO|nr:CapA family protein [Demequina sp. SYSU T00b26]MDN4473635.1 CapA family protein [Demequina sp. SYSU T00b26]
MRNDTAGRARRTRRTTALASLLGALGLLTIVAAIGAEVAGTDLAAPTPAASHSTTPSPSLAAPTEPDPVSFTLVAAGDVLPHSPVNRSAAVEGGYDYAPLMEGIAPFVSGADLALCHMEVPVAPDQGDITTFPVFGAPVELVSSLAEVGWNGCSTASNHSVDKGYDGVVATIEAFEAARLGYAGTARDEEEAASVQTYRIGDAGAPLDVAHVSYSYGTNGLPVTVPGSVDLFDADAADPTPIIEAAAAAREAGADVVIASVHCCVEYRTLPTDAQIRIAELIAESGTVDLYVGHHAHVPQPIVDLPGGPDGDGMWVAYGLGNMLSNQSSACCVPQTSNGVLLTATFTVEPSGEVDVGVEWTATTVDRSGGHRMYVLSGAEGPLGTLSADEVARRHAMVAKAVGDPAPERLRPAESLADYSYRLVRSPAAR